MQRQQVYLQIDPDASEPVYRQVVEGLRALLVNEQLQPGDQLPTVRELALDLGVHFNTVAEAYRLLASEGWIDLKRRRGATVKARAAPPATPESREQFGARLRSLVATFRAQGLPSRTISKELERMARELTEA